MVLKILKINYKIKNIANYIYNYTTKFESFTAIILYLEFNKKILPKYY